ncbi:hypothetical protein Y032_0443g1550 [Ancylostoma ceylanicum]|uniref:Uncharacterized protein n=1 Tax=Ancylostoma ceylanicum TaxID=53326 RepID=A0A016X0E3_9BILA|nr:hypothetical protein Y032_0443g1550 [Ancylostoma ceylanicum]
MESFYWVPRAFSAITSLQVDSISTETSVYSKISETNTSLKINATDKLKRVQHVKGSVFLLPTPWQIHVHNR